MKKSIKSWLSGLMLTSICMLSYAAVPQRPSVSPPPMPIMVNENTLVQTPLGIVPANKINEKDLPAILAPWVTWIKTKNQEDLCLLNNANEKQCIFAPLVEIGENESSFEFKISGTSYLNEFWMKVPSGQSQKVWPENILVNNQKGQVLEKDGFALVKVPKGDFNIGFNINKQELRNNPSLQLSQNFLIVKNKTTTSWLAENNQLLWITKKVDTKEETTSTTKSEEVKVYRKFNDGIPLRLETRIQVVYSGKEKEMFLGKVLPEEFKLLQIQSDVSINQREDGFYIKVTSGEHWLTFLAYSFSNTKNIVAKDLVKGVSNEFWSIQNDVNVRQTEIKSAQAVDPKQAFVPQEWQNLPTYNVKDSLGIETVRRGINLQDNLSYSANRMSWYGFNNDTMLHVDNMTFKNEGKSFMSFDSSITPKEFSLNQQPQMIVENEKKQGIVLRQGQYPASLYAQSATEFNTKFIVDSKQNLESWNLTIAPRHRLVHATGVDEAAGSWTNNWNLYTVFAIFLITLAFYKLFGLPLAVLSFSSILLFQSNPFLSWTIWPMLLLLMALLKVLPSKNKFTKLVRYTTSVLVVGVSFIFITFTVQESRYIVNGSLETNKHEQLYGGGLGMAEVEAPMPAPAPAITPMAAPMPPEYVIRDYNSKQADASNSDKSSIPTLSSNSVLSEKSPLDVLESEAKMKMMGRARSAPVSQVQFEEEVKSVESQRVQVTTGQPTWSGINYLIKPSSLMEEKAHFYIAKPWLVNIASIIQILDLLIVWAFLVMYSLNIYQKNQILDKFPSRFKNNRLVKPFLGEQK
jgi:hypothetical protein